MLGIPITQQIVFPSYNFTGDGVITSWTVVAEWHETGRFPELQIWRRRSGDTYDRIASTNLTATARNSNQLYSGTIDPPLQFQSGDILGMYAPPFADAQLLVSFSLRGWPRYDLTLTDEPLSSFTLPGESNSDSRPLLALEISECPLSAAVLC